MVTYAAVASMNNRACSKNYAAEQALAILVVYVMVLYAAAASMNNRARGKNNAAEKALAA